ncbi:DUF397 domain-containing protein [Streptomyces sp. NPDC093094]
MLATGVTHVSLRDSKTPVTGTLTFPRSVFARFLQELKA